MHSILRQQEAQFVAVGGCGCLTAIIMIIPSPMMQVKFSRDSPFSPFKTHRKPVCKLPAALSQLVHAADQHIAWA